jgi:hypothetical protein
MLVNEMLVNIIFGFIIPWLVGIYLVRKSPKILLLIFPVGALISMIINSLGFQMKFWDFTPLIPDDQSVSAMPLDLGLYPLIACFMIRTIFLHRKKTALIMFLFVLFTTLLEYMGLLIGKVTYGNGWNIGYTFLSYLLALGIVYLYFRLLERFRVL